LPEEIKFLEETNDHKDKDFTQTSRFSKLSIKGINANFDDIPLINCFELGAMIAGNTVKNIFERKNSVTENFDEQKGSIFKFISYVFFDEAVKLMNNHLYKIGKDFLVVALGNGKYLIDIIYKNKINLEIILQFFKINETKHMFSLNFKQVNIFINFLILNRNREVSLIFRYSSNLFMIILKIFLLNFN